MTKADRARELRYKKSIAQGFNIEEIQSELYDIQQACDEIRYIIDGDEDTLIDAFDGDEEEAYEFKAMFSELSFECEQISDYIYEEYVTEHFDCFFSRVAGGCTKRLGFDSFEEDYYQLTAFESRLSKTESENRLFRLTKQELINTAEQCFGIACAFLNVRYKYDYLKATLDILKNENQSIIETIKQIELAYTNAEKEKFSVYETETQTFERLVNCLPDRIWIE